MAKEKPERSQDRHKNKGKIIRLHDVYWRQLDTLVDRNRSDYTEEIRRALRSLLEEEGLWPPPASKGDP
jgi:hypothetical protein